MTFGGAGASLPILILLILNLIVLVPWIIWGKGFRRTRIILFSGAIIIFVLFFFLSVRLEEIPNIRNVVQIITLAIPILSLFLPSFYKRGSGE